MKREFKFDSGIPIPDDVSISDEARAMKVGESKGFDTRDEALPLYRAIRLVGFKSKMRKVKEDGKKRFRVWRAD